MDKVRLILADPDARYVDRVADFINSSFAGQIKTASFTKLELLRDYLKDNTSQTDILLAHPSFLEQVAEHLAEHLAEVDLILELSDVRPGGYSGERDRLFKYQPGDRLVSELMNVYTEKTAREVRLSAGRARTRVVTVYSPAGGTGKTSIFLGLCGELSRQGRNVLALSLESLCSTAYGFAGTGSGSLGELLLSFLEKPGSLPQKLDTLKVRDPIYNVDFLEAAECFTELDDFNQGLIGDLLSGIRDTGLYDFIIIDTDSKADEKTMSVLKASNSVVLVQTDDLMCHSKIQELFRQLERLDPQFKLELTGRIITAVNRHSRSEVCSSAIDGISSCVYLPFVSELWLFEDICSRCTLSPVFLESLRGLTGMLNGA